MPEAPGATPGQARQPVILTDVVRFTTVDLGDLRVVSGWRYASATDAAPACVRDATTRSRASSTSPRRIDD